MIIVDNNTSISTDTPTRRRYTLQTQRILTSTSFCCTLHSSGFPEIGASFANVRSVVVNHRRNSSRLSWKLWLSVKELSSSSQRSFTFSLISFTGSLIFFIFSFTLFVVSGSLLLSAILSPSFFACSMSLSRFPRSSLTFCSTNKIEQYHLEFWGL